MTLKELAIEYRESAQLLRDRLKELRIAEKKTDDSEERWHIHRRILELTPMLTEINKVAKVLEHYYERGFWRDETITTNCFAGRYAAGAQRKDTYTHNITERDDREPTGYVASVLLQRFHNPGYRKSKKRTKVHGESYAEKSRQKNSEDIKVPLTKADVDVLVNQFLHKKEK